MIEFLPIKTSHVCPTRPFFQVLQFFSTFQTQQRKALVKVTNIFKIILFWSVKLIDFIAAQELRRKAEAGK